MGGGRKLTADAPKGRPHDLIKLLFGGGEQSFERELGQATQFCEQAHTVPFRAAEGVTVKPGESVFLVVGDPPSVHRDGAFIGAVAGEIATAMRGCLDLGYRMRGAVTSFDQASQTGVVEVAGRRREVA